MLDKQIGNLIAFAHTVREGSISGAAERLGVTQSAVSQRLQKLEAAVGVKLHFRDREGFVLTPNGKDLYELADRQADLSDAISEKLHRYANAEVGQLSVGANAPLPALGYIASFGRVRPHVKVSFTLFDWTSIVRHLKDRTIDAAIVTALEPSPDWTLTPLGKTCFGAYIPAFHALAKQDSISLQDLEDETLILPEEGSLTARITFKAISAAGVRPRRTLRLTTFPLMKEAVLEGVGIALFLKDATAPTPGIVWRPVVQLDETFPLALAVPKGKEELGLVKAFQDSVASA